MKQVLVRYTIVAAIGAFLALFMSSCGTTAHYSTGYHAKVHHNQYNSCAAYQ